MNHTQLLNYLIEKYNLKSYLEIGVRTTEQNFDKIKCSYKIGVDPEIKYDLNIYPSTSDEFFEKICMDFDLIFIDGDHTADQVERDFNNSLKCLNDGGFIVIHDCLPEKEETTKVPRETKVWHGNVYKFVMNLHIYSGIDFVTLNTDEGCCIIWKDESVEYVKVKVSTTWRNYELIGKQMMNVIEPSRIDEYLPKVKEAVR